MVLHCIALLTRLEQGGGILEADLERVWSYGYTTAAEATSRSDVARPCTKWARLPLACGPGLLWDHANCCCMSEFCKA